ncbi:hypothetical protein QAD02_011752 [Eretmocerus hayati]|uniref:Uncharacterized protein n=1 Tax=Eretmocerus hayati TaxID=131215 RepID=A0ACC2NXT9_9HYME|nr:hypothetical protein QAD02_011752 [Eretmocerus hayati]
MSFWKFWVLKIFLVLFVGVSNGGGVSGLQKVWLPKTEWSDRENWMDGKLPRPRDLLIFPIDMRLAVSMPRNEKLEVSGVRLPKNGLVGLPEQGSILISETRHSSTNNLDGENRRESQWLRTGPFYWTDSENWSGSSPATPHLERLPCQNDEVLLPKSGATFSIVLPQSRDIEVKGIRLAGANESLASWEWHSVRGGHEFKGFGYIIEYSPLTGCQNCPCQEGDLSQYLEEICSIERAKCGLITCEYPLKVEGHCCHYCGARIKISEKTLLSTAQRVAKNVLKSYEDTLFWHSRTTWDGHSEILITEKGTYEGANAAIAIADVESAMKEEGVEVLFTETSGGPLYDHRILMTLGPFLSGIFILFLFVIVLCPIFGYTYTEIWEACHDFAGTFFQNSQVDFDKKSFAFARFENVTEGNVQLAEAEQATSQVDAGGRFENPLYTVEKRPKNGKKVEELNLNQPVSLVNLEKAIELDDLEEIEMDIEKM